MRAALGPGREEWKGREGGGGRRRRAEEAEKNECVRVLVFTQGKTRDQLRERGVSEERAGRTGSAHTPLFCRRLHSPRPLPSPSPTSPPHLGSTAYTGSRSENEYLGSLTLDPGGKPKVEEGLSWLSKGLRRAAPDKRMSVRRALERGGRAPEGGGT